MFVSSGDLNLSTMATLGTEKRGRCKAGRGVKVVVYKVARQGRPVFTC